MALRQKICFVLFFSVLTLHKVLFGGGFTPLSPGLNRAVSYGLVWQRAGEPQLQWLRHIYDSVVWQRSFFQDVELDAKIRQRETTVAAKQGSWVRKIILKHPLSASYFYMAAQRRGSKKLLRYMISTRLYFCQIWLDHRQMLTLISPASGLALATTAACKLDLCACTCARLCFFFFCVHRFHE